MTGVTPEEWRRLPPNQQAAHIAQYGPPPAHWGSIPYASLTAAAPPQAPTAPKRWPWIVVAVVVLLIIGVVSLGRGTATTGTTAASSTAQPVAQPTAAAPPASVAAPAAAAPQAGPPRAITARDWAKIAKNPDAHAGEALVIFGQVKQFDSVTGNDTFRASVDGVVHKVSYGFADYETNTVLTTQGADLSDLVQDDLFKAEVIVKGSLSYDTTLGGSTTVPHLLVTKITVTGSAK